MYLNLLAGNIYSVNEEDYFIVKYRQHINNFITILTHIKLSYIICDGFLFVEDEAW